MNYTRRRTAAVIGVIVLVWLAVWALSTVLGVAQVGSDTGFRACSSSQHLVIDPATGEGDCFWNGGDR